MGSRRDESPLENAPWRALLGGFVGGALVFWTPSISLHALSPNYGTLGGSWG